MDDLGVYHLWKTANQKIKRRQLRTVEIEHVETRPPPPGRTCLLDSAANSFKYEYLDSPTRRPMAETTGGEDWEKNIVAEYLDCLLVVVYQSL